MRLATGRRRRGPSAAGSGRRRGAAWLRLRGQLHPPTSVEGVQAGGEVGGGQEAGQNQGATERLPLEAPDNGAGRGGHVQREELPICIADEGEEKCLADEPPGPLEVDVRPEQRVVKKRPRRLVQDAAASGLARREVSGTELGLSARAAGRRSRICASTLRAAGGNQTRALCQCQREKSSLCYRLSSHGPGNNAASQLAVSFACACAVSRLT